MQHAIYSFDNRKQRNADIFAFDSIIISFGHFTYAFSGTFYTEVCFSFVSVSVSVFIVSLSIVCAVDVDADGEC